VLCLQVGANECGFVPLLSLCVSACAYVSACVRVFLDSDQQLSDTSKTCRQAANPAALTRSLLGSCIWLCWRSG